MLYYYYHILSEHDGGGVRSENHDRHAACRGRGGHNGTRLPASREQLSGVGRLVVCAVRTAECLHFATTAIISIIIAVCACMQLHLSSEFRPSAVRNPLFWTLNSGICYLILVHNLLSMVDLPDFEHAVHGRVPSSIMSNSIIMVYRRESIL